MAQSINIRHAVIVLGDNDTVGRCDLAEKAAEQGAVIAETYAFEPGEARYRDELVEVDAVREALGRAIATGADVWVPFPIDDLGREDHLRRVSLVLQRHGLNMLMGGELEPCTTDGGFSPMDFALRAEVQAVDALDRAAVATAGATTLVAEIERELRMAAEIPAPRRRRPVAPESGERYYSTGEVARFFGRSTQWVYRAMRSGVFTDADGRPIEPVRVGPNGRRRFSLPVLREMARACHRRGILGEDELLTLLAVLSRAEAE